MLPRGEHTLWENVCNRRGKPKDNPISEIMAPEIVENMCSCDTFKVIDMISPEIDSILEYPGCEEFILHTSPSGDIISDEYAPPCDEDLPPVPLRQYYKNKGYQSTSKS